MTQSIKLARRSVANLSTISAVFLAIAGSDTNANRHVNDPRQAMTEARFYGAAKGLLMKGKTWRTEQVMRLRRRAG